jgi:competence protein ComGC
MIEYISNPYIITVIISIITTLIIYYTKDNKQNNISKKYYFKIFIISLILINIILYFFKPYLFKTIQNQQNGGSINIEKKINTETSSYNLNIDDIHTGIPDF